MVADAETGRGYSIGKQVRFNIVYGRSAISAQMLEVSLLGVGTVLRLERDAWSMVWSKDSRQATNAYPSPRSGSVKKKWVWVRLFFQ